jgi:broad specificity phosphatase PhoE
LRHYDKEIKLFFDHMDKIILLIRHAESGANAGLATASLDSMPLTEKGTEQAQLLDRYLTDTTALKVVSPFLRAGQTAAPLIERFSSAEVENWEVE